MRKGNTYKLAQEVIVKLREYSDILIDEISVNELNLPFCISCHKCFEKGEENCPHFSIVNSVAKKMEESDAIILSGVVYSMQLNAAMKNLIDHLSYYFHRPRLFDKKGMVITTTAGSGEKDVAKYLKSIMNIWGISDVKIISEKIRKVPFSLTDKQRAKISKTTDNFYNDIIHNKHTAPSYQAIAMYNAFRGMSSAENVISERDREYWKETGLVNTTYPTRHGIVKKLYGALTFKILRSVINKNGKSEK